MLRARGGEFCGRTPSRFMTMRPTITVETQKIIQSGDIVLLYSQWSLTGTGADGEAIHMAGQGTEVARGQPNGDWLFVIDNPFDVD